MAISRKHRDHYLWSVMQSYSAILKNLTRQARAKFVWYPKQMGDLKMIHDENNIITVVIVRDFLKTSKDACLYLCVENEHACGVKV